MDTNKIVLCNLANGVIGEDVWTSTWPYDDYKGNRNTQGEQNDTWRNGFYGTSTRRTVYICFICLYAFSWVLLMQRLWNVSFIQCLFNDDFVSLPKYHIYTKLMIERTMSKEFSAIIVNDFALWNRI